MAARTHAPSLPFPPPLRGSDNNYSGFTNDSIVRRLPLILAQMIKENSFSEDQLKQLEELKQDIVQNRGVQKLVGIERDPHGKDWAAFIEPFVGKSWLEGDSSLFSLVCLSSVLSRPSFLISSQHLGSSLRCTSIGESCTYSDTSCGKVRTTVT